MSDIGQLRRDLAQPPHTGAPTAGRSSGRAFSARLQNFDGFCDLFGQWIGEFRQLSRGPFQGEAQLVQGRDVGIFRAETNQSLLTRGLDNSGFATFIPITRQNQASVWQGGRRLSAGQLIAKSPDIEYHNRTHRGDVIVGLFVPVQTLAAATRALTGADSPGKSFTWAALRPDPRALSTFQQSLRRVLTAIQSDPTVFDSASGCVLEGECMRSLVDMLAGPATEKRTPRALRERQRLVKRAVDYIQERLKEPLKPFSALELCHELGVADRTLRRVFKEAFGMGPVAYTRVMRMHSIRLALLEGRGHGLSVADVLGRWGVTRHGSFAAEYARHFGELPSRTLGVRVWSGE